MVLELGEKFAELGMFSSRSFKVKNWKDQGIGNVSDSAVQWRIKGHSASYDPSTKRWCLLGLVMFQDGVQQRCVPSKGNVILPGFIDGLIHGSRGSIAKTSAGFEATFCGYVS